MEKNVYPTVIEKGTVWYSESFISASVTKHLQENGYRVQKDARLKDSDNPEKILIASKFFKKEIIEVKAYPDYNTKELDPVATKNIHTKGWFTEALFNSFVNFSTFENVEIAMAVPNVGRYKAIIKNLNDYFTANDLYFRVYLVNEDGTVEVSNLNYNYLKNVS